MATINNTKAGEIKEWSNGVELQLNTQTHHSAQFIKVAMAKSEKVRHSTTVLITAGESS